MCGVELWWCSINMALKAVFSITIWKYLIQKVLYQLYYFTELGLCSPLSRISQFRICKGSTRCQWSETCLILDKQLWLDRPTQVSYSSNLSEQEQTRLSEHIKHELADLSGCEVRGNKNILVIHFSSVKTGEDISFHDKFSFLSVETCKTFFV